MSRADEPEDLASPERRLVDPRSLAERDAIAEQRNDSNATAAALSVRLTAAEARLAALTALSVQIGRAHV